jgi:hypothetical protein
VECKSSVHTIKHNLRDMNNIVQESIYAERDITYKYDMPDCIDIA